MTELCKQTTAILILSTTPPAAGIVDVAPVPETVYLHHIYIAQLVIGHQLFYFLHWWVVTVLLHGKYRLTRLFSGCNHAAALINTYCHGLFHYGMQPCIKA